MKPTTYRRRTGLLSLAAAILITSFLALPASLVLALPATPPWVRCGVVYEIFPRNFSPEGNFDGITARLDQLKDLGVNIHASIGGKVTAVTDAYIEIEA